MADTIRPTPATCVAPITTLIETLRGPKGCPWDKKQTPASMTRYLIEEVYELVDAILSEDTTDICEEAGDVMFQLLFIIHMFTTSGDFDLATVIEKNLKKMVRRHPHVFGDATAQTTEKVRENWEEIKRAEKRDSEASTVLSSIPKSASGLVRASIVSERAARTGFDWDNIISVMDKTMEEWKEFSKEIANLDDPCGHDKATVEFGDILFTMVNVARFARIHPEIALIRSIQKFEKRFAFMEEKAIGEGRKIEDLTLQEMNSVWEDAKARFA